MPGKCSFNTIWLSNTNYKLWLKREEDPGRAGCKLCVRSFDISNMGEAALVSHAKGKKHTDNQKAAEQTTSVSTYFAPRPAVASTDRPNVTASSSTRQPTINQSITSNDVLSAEILWSMKCMDSHYSYHSCANAGEVFRTMFPDSDIASKFSLGETKAAYLAVFGIAPYFKSLLVREICMVM